MAKAKEKNVASLNNNPVARALQGSLKSTYALYLITHNYHWNVEGRHFVGLHSLFEQQYNELFLAVDTIAERIRALDAYALPNHYEDILEAVQNLSNPLNKETDKNAVAQRMIENLVAMNTEAIESAQETKEAAAKAQDDETEDLMIERITIHQKARWMLKSLLK